MPNDLTNITTTPPIKGTTQAGSIVDSRHTLPRVRALDHTVRQARIPLLVLALARIVNRRHTHQHVLVRVRTANNLPILRHALAVESIVNSLPILPLVQERVHTVKNLPILRLAPEHQPTAE